MTREHIGKIDEFPENEGKKVKVNGTEIAIFKLEDGVKAILNRCVHKDLPLHFAGQEKIVSEDIKPETRERYGAPERGNVDPEECTIQCPWHYLEWDLESGQNELTDRQMPMFDVEIEGEDVYLNM